MSVTEFGYKRLARPLLFQRSKEDPERAHEWALDWLGGVGRSRMQMRLAQALWTYRHPMLEQTLCGLRFPTPLGLAAGFDKNGLVAHVLPSCGWGFVTIGAVLLNPQPGNSPRPRVWRSTELQALCNWLGFNSEGMRQAAANLARQQPLVCVPRVLNIGKNRDASPEQALQHYPVVFRHLWRLVDAAEANPSSPNTPGLRELQKREALRALLFGLQQVNRERATFYGMPEKPLGAKFSPDESDEALQDIVDVAVELHLQFLSLTNTTVSRDGTQGWEIPSDRGGVSGAPLTKRALRVLTEVHLELKRRGVRDQFVLNGAGGIRDANTLFERITHGADICSALTAWPFEGPDWPARTNKGLVRLLRSNGFNHVRDAVGAAV